MYTYQRIIILMLFMGLIISPVEAAIITSDATPTSIFKCGESTISATFDDGGITAVVAWSNATVAVNPMIPGSGRVYPEMAPAISDAMAYNGTHWVATFGDDSSMLWGNRAISYVVTNGGTTIYPSSSSVFVYNTAETCTGTGKNSYKNYTRGIGNYTNMIVSGDMDLLTWSIYPWIQYWGYLFYVIILLITISVIHFKTQNVMHVIYTVFAFLLVISTTGAIPMEFRSYVIALVGLAIGAILYRVFTRDV